MKHKTVKLRDTRLEMILDGEVFMGLGTIHVGDTQVRNGRLPLGPFTQSFSGVELRRLEYLGVDESSDELRIHTTAVFGRMPTKVMRDHSLDPIHDVGDWDDDAPAGRGRLDLVLRPAGDTFNGVRFAGFSYHYEYESDAIELYWLLDRSSFELDGDITGATVVSQSSCSDPVVTLDSDTAWTTEGVIFWVPGLANPVMTHNLPRWASHGSFDFQYRGDKTLLGVFERVDLIRSVLRREPGCKELKCFDKHIFDQTGRYCTSAKSILLNVDAKNEVDQRNLWTWVFDEVHARARAEFGLAEAAALPRLSVNYWENFTVDSYYPDLLPAAANLGMRQVFIDNLKKSAATEDCPNPGKFHWNMCVPHELEIAPKLGGVERVKAFLDHCRQHGIQVMCWTSNTQGLSSPINASERDDGRWFVRLDDTRQKYGGAYTGCMSAMDLASEPAYRYFVDSHKQLKDGAGMKGLFWDSFYNLAFMPVSFRDGTPHTHWRQCLRALKELQDAGIDILIESFGPFAGAQHGCPASYSLNRCWVCYKVGLGDGYTTVPSGGRREDARTYDAGMLYYALAHMTVNAIPLFLNGRRIDEVFDEGHRQALRDYHAAQPLMGRRYLQEDDTSVLWHDRERRQAVLFNFRDRRLALPGRVHDVTTEADLPPGDQYEVQAQHTYIISETKALPTRVSTPG